LLAFALSVTSSISWGFADFLGGVQSRRMHVLGVVLISQSFGLLFAILALPLLADQGLSTGEFAIAAGAGAAGVVGLIGFYSAMSMGTMSLVAPIAAMGVAVPVFVGLVRGEDPGALQLAGVVVAVVAIVLVTREDSEQQRTTSRLPIALALLAALGFGAFLTLIDSTADIDTAWTLAAVRVGGVSVAAIALLATRPTVGLTSAAVPVLAVVGFFDVAANGIYALATTKGLLPVVAVGGSLYPAVTILLAHRFLDERLAPVQRAGVVLALTGVVMLAAGS
jgi:drug/metabolite transporter (DMT)-like permease